MQDKINTINSILNEFLEPYNLTAELGEDFAYYPNENLITYSFIISDLASKTFNQFIHNLEPTLNIDIFLISFLHEVGHNETYWDLTYVENKKCDWIKEYLRYKLDLATTEKAKMRLYNKYYYLKDEYNATRWALDYIKSNREEVSALWGRLQESILDFYNSL